MYSQPAVAADGTVYVKTFGLLQGYDPSGKLKWRSPKGVFVDFDSLPVVGKDGTVYLRESMMRFKDAPDLFGTNDGIVALRTDGSVKWRASIKDANRGGGPDSKFSLDDHDTLYCTVGSDFLSQKTLVAIGEDGKERWRFKAEDNMTAPIEIQGDGRVMFLSTSNVSHLYEFDRDGNSTGFKTLTLRVGVGFSVGSDGSIYIPAGLNSTPTLTAMDRTGSLKWQFKSNYRAWCAPVIGPDGTLYFTMGFKDTNFLVALSNDGKLKWQYDLGHHFSMDPPVVASDGTVFVVSCDPKVTAVNADGTLRWVFRAPRRWHLPGSWGEFTKELRERVKDEGNVLVGQLTLTTNGILYAALDNKLYVLDVGVGLATNSPWPMAGGNPRLTGQIKN
jgi:outer membrane protein assembly factor BamB